jgi:hypothetical protein
VLRFTGIPNASYTVQYTASLPGTTWQRLTNFQAQTTTGLREAVDGNVGAGGKRFYRVVSPIQP